LKGLVSQVKAYDFKAYYTRLPFEDEISGRCADVVVSYGDSQLVFCRETSFLPYWKTPQGKWSVKEIIPRGGDGPALRHDKHNKYSYVRIIGNKTDQVVIHWRYIPDFKDIDFTSVVHEVYTLRPDYNVKREIIQEREKLAVFTDPGNRAIQVLKLKPDGIQVMKYQSADPIEKPMYEPVTGSPVIHETVAKPAAWWLSSINATGRKRAGSSASMIVGGWPCCCPAMTNGIQSSRKRDFL